MKRSYLWFGLAVPALGGGVLAFLKSRKISGNGDGTRKADGKKEEVKNKIKKEISITEAKEPGSKTLSPPAERKINRIGNSTRPANPQGNSSDSSKKYLTGAKGGKYYLNEKGQKIYLKK